MFLFQKLAYWFCYAAVLLHAFFASPGISVYAQQPEGQRASVRIEFGQRVQKKTVYSVQLLARSAGMQIAKVVGQNVEKNDFVGVKTVLNTGPGDIDVLTAEVSWPKPTAIPRKLASHKDSYTVKNDAMWGYLMENGSPGQSARLKDDTWQQPDAPVLTIQLADDGTRGFSVALEQLLRHGAMWFPEHGIYVTLADKPVEFVKHLASLTGQRTLDQVQQAPDATLSEFKNRWEDFGNPNQWDVPWQTKYLGTRGHLIVTAPAHGSLYKIAIDRWANVRPDFASPHRFRFDLLWPESQWKSQTLVNGLPICVTRLERGGQFCEIEQLVAPLTTTPGGRSGESSGVMLTRLRLSGKAGPVAVGFRLTSEVKNAVLEAKKIGPDWAVVDRKSNTIWLLLETGPGFSVQINPSDSATTSVELSCTGALNPGETREILAKLSSPPLAETDHGKLKAVDFAAARLQVVNYWENWLRQGATFQVPEPEVNNLFRANLWHALILPRHRMDEQGRPHMDLPYANTAYGQKNADWPINQVVYVDYMLYGLRGHWQVANDEIAAMFQSQQQPDGRIGGFANWGVYSPGHLYAIAKNYLLSRDQAGFDRLLPQSLKTLDWCLAQVAKASQDSAATGLIRAPLNDLTHAEREWAFSQAYFVAGLDLFGQALSVHKYPRAGEVLKVAAKLKQDVERAFSRSSVRSAVVQLADGSWSNFVPTDAMTPRRMMEQWYPTDVDCGPLHLSRLEAVDPRSWLTTAMLHDHEDNLFLKNQGAANEPVYVQQASVYSQRDQPKAVIRAFYSLMACGFSHHQLSPVEHRWAWGQYYGPPSTDGAWFEILRNMLLNERKNQTLLIGQAVPRPWLEEGKQITVRQAPTYFGPLSFTMESHTASGQITARVELSNRNPPNELLVRFRHPQEKPLRTVLVNGKPWKDFDARQEWVRIPKPAAGTILVTAKYE
ncbi:hypothetical protein LX87_04744 [Larkinella arboricola]|uniref:Glycosyl hydrolase family 65 n=1 Tax=Larkinella arboricola TaxID=643671 RepID=A0A327WQW0_LARAB|nr:hypothetical protein [Larkinella arboricola]RAJ93232.1 hypothetical protein LX87_04744 [Larkinella arboricola]